MRPQVGDRVRFNDSAQEMFKGREGTVVQTDINLTEIKIDNDNISSRGFYRHRFDIINDATSFIPEDWS